MKYLYHWPIDWNVQVSNWMLNCIVPNMQQFLVMDNFMLGATNIQEMANYLQLMVMQGGHI